MPTSREFLDFWVENSIHPAEPLGSIGGEQDVSVLVTRCIEMAESQGLSIADLEQEVGDLRQFIQRRLRQVNKAESDRPDRR